MEANWQVSKTLVQIHHLNKLRKSKIIPQDLDLYDNFTTFMRLMLELFHNELYSTSEDS